MLAVTAVVAILLGAGIVERAATLDTQRADAITQLRAVSAEADRAAQRNDYLNGAIAVAEQDTADRVAVLAVRPAFVTEITALSAALSGAEGMVDTTADRASAVSLQQAVLAEVADPSVVTNATATLHAMTAKLAGIVRTPSLSSGGPSGYSRVRAALDRVGGSGIGLYESASCAGGSADACANSDGYIKYRADIAGWSSTRLNWAMAHELAHIYQFRVWGALTASATYNSSFRGDPEFLANCMAVVRGFPGSVGCSSAQQTWASGIWVGIVR